MKSSYYYGKDKHKYMLCESRVFADYIYSLVSDNSFSNYASAIELGAGMGRFSAAVITNFSNVTLVEPVDDHADTLKKLFPDNGAQIVCAKAEDFLADLTVDEPAIVFCFHLMHHLKREQREAIYQFVKRTGSKCVAVEPNPYNPLILLQIIFQPDMSLAEEMQYLILTHRKYRKEVEKNGLVLSSFRRICFFPPFVTNLLLKRFARPAIAFLEVFNRFLPFLGSYQLIVCEGKN